MRRRWSLLIAVLVAVACGGGSPGSQEPPAPGLEAATEIPLVEVSPDPNTESFEWASAYQAGDLPKLNVGRPSEKFFADAHRESADVDNWLCLGDGGSGGCSPADPGRPAVTGLTFGGPDVRAWAWSFVPDEAVAVRFTDQDGTVGWQRPAGRVVVFPDTIEDGPAGGCRCRLDAIDSNGEVIASVDLEQMAYVGSS